MLNPLKWIGADIRARRSVNALARGEKRGVVSEGDLFKRGLEMLAVRNNVTDPMAQVGAVYTAISTLMQAMASVRCLLYKGDARVDDHPYLRLRRHPNDSLIGTQLIEGTVALREMAGRAFWLLDGLSGVGRAQTPTRILLLDPLRMKPRTVAGELAGWTYQPKGGASKNLSVDEVVRFAYFDHRDPYGGLGPLEASRLAHSLAWKSSRMQEQFYTNGGIPPFYVKYPPGAPAMSAPQKKALRDEFRENYLTLGNSWTPPFMFGGAELASISVNQRDAEWMATQKMTTHDILAIFGVPAEYAGYSENGLGAGGVSTEAKRRFWAFRVRGIGDHIEAAEQARVVDRFWPGLTLKNDWRAKFSEVLPEETRASVDSALKLISVGVTPVAAFEFFDMAVSAEGAPWLEEGWLPFNTVLAKDKLLEVSSDPAEKSASNSAARSWPKGERLRAAIWQARAASMEKLERRMLGDYRSFLQWLGEATIDEVGRGAEAASSQLSNIERLLRKASTPPAGEIHRVAIEKTEAARVWSAKTGWESLVEEVSGSTVFEPNDPAVKVLLKAREQEIVGASDTIAKRLRAALNVGVDKGESPTELAARVRAVIREAYNGQAKVVARTETAAAYGGARNEAMKQEGITEHEWLSARDERVRETHQIDGEVVRIGSKFSNGLTRPHDPGADAGEVIQCRCVALPVLGGK